MPIKKSLSKWIQTDGGPLILIEKRLMDFWEGSLGENVITDYDRACLIDDFLGLVDVESSPCLILNDEPLRTAIWQENPDEAIFVRWRWANNEETIKEILPKSLKLESWEKSEIKLSLSGDELFLFDSSYGGKEVEESLNLKLPKGQYYIYTLFFEPDNETAFILHLLSSRR